MTDYEFRQADFEHPSTLFSLEDKLKGLIGGPLLYNPYFKDFDQKKETRGCLTLAAVAEWAPGALQAF